MLKAPCLLCGPSLASRHRVVLVVWLASASGVDFTHVVSRTVTMEPHGACGLQRLGSSEPSSVCGVAACWAVVITRSDWRIGCFQPMTTLYESTPFRSANVVVAVYDARSVSFDGNRLSVVRGFTVVTWLILPVVICLSQRLSHACLSISLYMVRLRMAH